MDAHHLNWTIQKINGKLDTLLENGYITRIGGNLAKYGREKVTVWEINVSPLMDFADE